MVEIDAVSDTSKWDDHSTLVERYTEWIVKTVTEANVRATFFILGWIAERHPNMVKMIAEGGRVVVGAPGLFEELVAIVHRVGRARFESCLGAVPVEA